jgi:hypothetical protein
MQWTVLGFNAMKGNAMRGNAMQPQFKSMQKDSQYRQERKDDG